MGNCKIVAKLLLDITCYLQKVRRISFHFKFDIKYLFCRVTFPLSDSHSRHFQKKCPYIPEKKCVYIYISAPWTAARQLCGGVNGRTGKGALKPQETNYSCYAVVEMLKWSRGFRPGAELH